MRKYLILLILTCITLNANCGNVPKPSFDWTNVINAIIHVESKGDENAVSKCGNCVGIMQIKKIVVDDCNEYLRMKGIKNKTFTYQDRYNKEKSIEMFLLIQDRYNKTNNVEEGIKIWNGGCCYKTNPKLLKQSNKYYLKVMDVYNKGTK